MRNEHNALTAEVARLYAYIANIEVLWREDQKCAYRAMMQVEALKAELARMAAS